MKVPTIVFYWRVGQRIARSAGSIMHEHIHFLNETLPGLLFKRSSSRVAGSNSLWYKNTKAGWNQIAQTAFN